MFSRSLIKKEQKHLKKKQEKEYQVKRRAEQLVIQNKITEKNKFQKENKK